MIFQLLMLNAALLVHYKPTHYYLLLFTHCLCCLVNLPACAGQIPRKNFMENHELSGAREVLLVGTMLFEGLPLLNSDFDQT